MTRCTSSIEFAEAEDLFLKRTIASVCAISSIRVCKHDITQLCVPTQFLSTQTESDRDLARRSDLNVVHVLTR